MNKFDEMVNLFFIGVPSSGTTSLAFYLQQHQDVFVSQPKETCFHILEWERGYEYYRQNYFANYSSQNIICDASILNLYYSSKTAARIYRDFPNAKFLVVLRNPIDRAYSDYCDAVNRGLERLTFEKAFYVERKRSFCDKWPLQPRMYFKRGLYADQMNYFLRYFSQDSFKIIMYKDYCSDKRQVLKEIFNFLNIKDHTSTIKFGKKLHVNNKKTRSAYLQRFLQANHKVGNTIKQMTPWFIRKHIVNYKARIMELNLKNGQKDPIDINFKLRLIDYYKKSNDKIESELGLDLKRWSEI